MEPSPFDIINYLQIATFRIVAGDFLTYEPTCKIALKDA